MEVSGKELLRSSIINSKHTNPWLKSAWQPDVLANHAQKMAPEILEPWIKSILHLQAFAWRFHFRSCVDAKCLGCGDDDGANIKDIEVRQYFRFKQAEYLAYEGMEGWVIAGRRFGKSEVGIFDVICKLLGYNPITHELLASPQRWWLVGLSFPMLRDNVIDTFKRIMPSQSAKWSGDDAAWDFKKGDLTANIFNGSQAIFKSCEAGEEKFQSVGLNGSYFDEEPGENIYKETRLRIKGGTDLFIRGTMTPNRTKGLTWTYKKIFKNEKRQAEGTLKVWTGSSYENTALNKEILDQYVGDVEEWERQVVIEGRFSIGLGRGAFSPEKLISLKDKAIDPLRRENLAGGILSVWEDPVEDACYSIGADPAEGLEHGDNTAGCVIKRMEKELKVVATLVGAIDPDIMGRELCKLAISYNNAWIVCESNNHGLTTIKEIQRQNYINLYADKSQEELQGVTESRKMGWYTNSLSRQILVDEIARFVREDIISIPDDDTVDEMTTFIVGRTGTPKGQGGCKDDRVFALGLAIQGHVRCPMTARDKEIPTPAKKVYNWWDDVKTTVGEELAWMSQ